jgi:hypothetical protein
VNELPRHEGPYWLRGTGRVGDPDCYDKEPDKRVPSESPAERLKWMLGYTMGSPDAFEFRREELSRAKQQGASASVVTDEEVAQSYIDTCLPSSVLASNKDGDGRDSDNLMMQYLEQATLTKRIGNVLFLHGALPRRESSSTQDGSSKTTQQASSKSDYDYSYAVPWRSQGGSNKHTTQVLSPADALDEINSFGRQQMEHFCNYNKQVTEDDYVSSIEPWLPWCASGGYTNTNGGEDNAKSPHPHPGGALIQYGMGGLPDKTRNPTIVYNSWLSDGMPEIIYNNDLSEEKELLHHFMDQTQLQMIVTGHKPHGDAPLPIRIVPTTGNNKKSDDDSTSSSSKWIVTGDTSYSGDTMWVNNGRTNVGRGESKSGRGDVAVR